MKNLILALTVLMSGLVLVDLAYAEDYPTRAEAVKLILKDLDFLACQEKYDSGALENMKSFSDVKGHPLAKEIALAKCDNIVLGDNKSPYEQTFRPDDKIRWSELAALLVRAYELKVYNWENDFWYEPYMEALSMSGIGKEANPADLVELRDLKGLLESLEQNIKPILNFDEVEVGMKIAEGEVVSIKEAEKGGVGRVTLEFEEPLNFIGTYQHFGGMLMDFTLRQYSPYPLPFTVKVESEEGQEWYDGTWIKYEDEVHSQLPPLETGGVAKVRVSSLEVYYYGYADNLRIRFIEPQIKFAIKNDQRGDVNKEEGGNVEVSPWHR